MSKKIIKKIARRFREPLSKRIANLEQQVEHLGKVLVDHEAASSERETFFYNELKKQNSNAGFIKLSETEILTKIFTGAKFYLDPRDIALVPHLVLDKIWEHNITNAWLSIVKAGDRILDIGANFGYFGVLAAQQANRNCEVILFEANPNLISYLEKTVTVNSFTDVIKIENLAVSNTSGEIRLNIIKDYIASSSVHDVKKLNSYNKNGVEFKIDSFVKIPAVAIDYYCETSSIKEINLIKMDIEGYEDVAYDGMKSIVKSSPNLTLFIEFTSAGYKNPREFYNMMLKDFGNLYLIDEQGKLYRPKSSNYEYVIAGAPDWVMLVLSKVNNLDKTTI